MLLPTAPAIAALRSARTSRRRSSQALSMLMLEAGRIIRRYVATAPARQAARGLQR
jgi:hypothetical protein